MNSIEVREEGALSVEREGRTLRLRGTAPLACNVVEIELRSDRNAVVSSIRDVSPCHPDAEEERRRQAGARGNLFYPVVDVKLERGLRAEVEFSGVGENGRCVLSGPLWREEEKLCERLTIPSGRLQVWENSVYVSEGAARMTDFALVARLPNLTGRWEYSFRLLSDDWRGSVRAYGVTGEGRVELGEVRVRGAKAARESGRANDALSEENLSEALDECVEFTTRCQIEDRRHPFHGNLFLFYDLDARVYRSFHWIWGCGPSVEFLLRAAERESHGGRREELRGRAKAIGNCALRFLLKEEGHPCDGALLTRWDRDLDQPAGYSACVTMADALFFARWAWAPLYRCTGDASYLEALREQCRVTAGLLEKWEVIPHSYYVDRGEWTDWVIDETGFGSEGFAALQEHRPDEGMRNAGIRFLDEHVSLFEREDGLWDRLFEYSTRRMAPSKGMVRGLGWAMEGLLAGHRLAPENGYLEKARRMADAVMVWQRPDGGWSFEGKRSRDEVGDSEKGTPLWSWLLYKLYQECGEEGYRQAAGRALQWGLRNRYRGPDAEARGTLVGCSPQSGVGYRQWFRVSCVYASAFLGLAILEEGKTR